MCGIAGILGRGFSPKALVAMVEGQRHRGPDSEGLYVCGDGDAALAHDRLAILDLSDAGRQPMISPDGRYSLVFNGEVYNHEELRRELPEWPFQSRTDSEVVLASFVTWGPACLERFLGMFAFAVWDDREKTLFAARDRFGVKPFHYHDAEGSFVFASEVHALHAAGVPAEPDAAAWARWLAYGVSDHDERTFWSGIRALPAGCSLTVRDGCCRVTRWYDLAAAAAGDEDRRSDRVVLEELRALLVDSVRLRFRSDVPVGVNLSGGLDSATLLGLVHEIEGSGSEVKTFTFVTGDPTYDELPWVRQMLARTRHPSVVSRLTPGEVPGLAESLAETEDGPYGGLPTLAYAKLFEAARAEGCLVTLDGQGMDEPWAGYDYYAAAAAGADPAGAPTVQGGGGVRRDVVSPELLALAEPPDPPRPFADALRNLSLRDLLVTKIPRALRYNDRASMRASVELREPFLDHRLVELALRQPAARKVRHGVRKWLVRELTKELLPAGVVEAPKRPMQTPQREWLRGPLAGWAREKVEEGMSRFPGWLDRPAAREALRRFFAGEGESSHFVWQWISLALTGVRSAARV